MDRRAKDLGIDYVEQAVTDKLAAFNRTLEALKIDPDQACVVGDDLVDIPPMKACQVQRVTHHAITLSNILDG